MFALPAATSSEGLLNLQGAAAAATQILVWAAAVSFKCRREGWKRQRQELHSHQKRWREGLFGEPAWGISSTGAVMVVLSNASGVEEEGGCVAFVKRSKRWRGCSYRPCSFRSLNPTWWGRRRWAPCHVEMEDGKAIAPPEDATNRFSALQAQEELGMASWASWPWPQVKHLS